MADGRWPMAGTVRPQGRGFAHAIGVGGEGGARLSVGVRQMAPALPSITQANESPQAGDSVH
jgi:hypothetical protein